MKKYLIFFLSCLSLFSCGDEEEIKTLGETEYYFDEKLSSISSDRDGSFWVGSETGDIFNFKDNYRVSFDLAEDRIYKVNRDVSMPGDTVFWIGVRNSGLQKWKKTGNGKLTKVKTFTINFKKDKYSAYDFVMSADNNKIYIGTSQGVYFADKNSDADSLSLIFPSREFLSAQNGTTFVVHNISLYRDSLLLASTQGGVFLYNIQNRKSRFMFKDKFIEHVSVYNDTIFTVAKGSLYLNNLKGDILKKIDADNSPKLYYRMQGIHCLVGSEELLLSNDLDKFLRIRLRRTVPGSRSRNVILPDTLNNFTYLLTENAVWRISNNIDAFKRSKPIKASCSDAKNIYYLSLQNELYVQNKFSNEAKWVYTFPENNLIQWMDIIGDDLYFYNIDNEYQKMTISDGWIRNTLFNSPRIILKSGARITSAGIKKMGEKTLSYLGIQDGLIVVDENNRIDTIPEFSSEYITSMFGHEDISRLYISTLNNGVFYIDRDKQIRQVAETEGMSFIQDIITTNNHNSNLITLTNQHIISQNPKDTIRVKGYRKLLYANDTLFYALPEFGIRKFIISGGEILDKGLFYGDIHFNQTSSLSAGNRIILGSGIGALSFLPDQEKKYQWINFGNVLNVNILHTVLLALLFIALVGFVILILIRRQNADIVQIRKRKGDLAKRIEDITPFYSILGGAERLEISDLENLVEAIDINSEKKDDINIQLEKFSLQLAKLNRKIALLLPKKLEDQIGRITQTDAFEKPILLSQSEEVMAQNDIELIKDQIRLNDVWLERYVELSKTIGTDIENLSDCVEIDGVNKNLYSNLKSVEDSIRHQPLAMVDVAYNEIKKNTEKIHTSQSSQIIDAYISEMRAYLEAKTLQDSGLSFMLEYLDKTAIYPTSGSNMALLKKMKRIDDEISIMKNLDDIKLWICKYKDQYNQIVKDNEEQINKKFDKELASFISDNTDDTTRHINVLITALYDKLLKNDSYVITDLLKLGNLQGQQAKVLALLIADMKIKRSLISGILGVYGNLNPVISRLINDKIKVNETALREFQKSDQKKNILVYFILRLLD